MAITASVSAANQGIAAAEPAGVATAAATEEFRNIPLNQIIVERQIRTGIDMEDESSQGFIDSVAEKGVIEPVIVTPRGEKFLLLAGERRFLACQKLGLETIPARILLNVQSKEEILTIQLIENLQRQDIDPIDKANGILAFFQNRHSGMDLDAVMNDLILYDREDQRVPGDIVATVATISKIAGIKARSIQNLLSLLRLPPEIRDSVKKGAIGVSQGYLFAANLDHSTNS